MREVAAAAKSEGVGALGEFLQPGRHVKLRIALRDAALHAPDPEHEQQEKHERRHDRGEREQIGVVEGKHREADERDRHHADAVYEQRGKGLLDGRHLEEPIHDVGRIATVKGLDLGPGEMVGKSVGRPHEESPLQAFDHEELHRPKQDRKNEESKHHAREHNDWPELHAEGHGVDERLDGGRRHDREHAHGHRESDHGPEVAPLEAQRVREPLPRPCPRSGMVMVVRQLSLPPWSLARVR